MADLKGLLGGEPIELDALPGSTSTLVNRKKRSRSTMFLSHKNW